jgi:branched-chain amino acid transport system substrate-binding protein
MKLSFSLSIAAVTLASQLYASVTYAASNQVVIGNIDDMSGLYADLIGPGGVEAVKMAIEDFGGTALGQPIVLLNTDHQNKPDIGTQKLREWSDRDNLTMVLGGSNTGVSIALSSLAKERKLPFIAIGAAGASLTGKDCSPYTIHYSYDTTALGNGTAKAIVKEGGKSWYFLTADYAFGTQLQEAATNAITSEGGEVLGSIRVPLSTTDFSSFLLQAQASGAEVIGLANAGADFTNSLKAAIEFGVSPTMRPAALLAYISDIHSLGLETAQGLYLTTSWYWDLNDDTRAFAKRFSEKMNRPPTMNQAAYYSATTTYLNAVKAAGTTEGDAVMAKLRETKINDMFTTNGWIRSDGLMEHDMYVMQVKTPAQSQYPWDYYRVVEKLTGEEAFGKLSDSTCALVKK